MPKVYKYQVGDKVIVSKVMSLGSTWLGKKGVISELREASMFDYTVEFENGRYFFYEKELTKLNIHNFVIGQFVKLKSNDEVGTIETIDEENMQLEIEFLKDFTMGVYGFDQVEIYQYEGKSEQMSEKNEGYFENLGTKVGQLVDKKQQAYGDSVSKTYQLMQIFMENYDNGDDTYTIPKSLLKHILLQVRIIDKQNRIFSNPDGDLMQENPYMDTVGYGLLGTRMCEPDNK